MIKTMINYVVAYNNYDTVDFFSFY